MNVEQKVTPITLHSLQKAHTLHTSKHQRKVLSSKPKRPRNHVNPSVAITFDPSGVASTSDVFAFSILMFYLSSLFSRVNSRFSL